MYRCMYTTHVCAASATLKRCAYHSVNYRVVCHPKKLQDGLPASKIIGWQTQHRLVTIHVSFSNTHTSFIDYTHKYHVLHTSIVYQTHTHYLPHTKICFRQSHGTLCFCRGAPQFCQHFNQLVFLHSALVTFLLSLPFAVAFGRCLFLLSLPLSITFCLLPLPFVFAFVTSFSVHACLCVRVHVRVCVRMRVRIVALSLAS